MENCTNFVYGTCLLFHFKSNFFQFSISAFQCDTLFWSQDSSVGIVTRSLAGRYEIQMVAGGIAFPLLQYFQPALLQEMRRAQIRTERQTIFHTRVPFTHSAIHCSSSRESSLPVTVPRRSLVNHHFL